MHPKAIWYPVDDPAQPLIRHIVGVEGVTAIRLIHPTEPNHAPPHYEVWFGSSMRFRLDAQGSGAEFEEGR